MPAASQSAARRRGRHDDGEAPLGSLAVVAGIRGPGQDADGDASGEVSGDEAGAESLGASVGASVGARVGVEVVELHAAAAAPTVSVRVSASRIRRSMETPRC
jgi:hypothetical protein